MHVEKATDKVTRMKFDRPRWKLKHLAIAIAFLAVAFGVFGIGGTIVGVAFCLPSMIAPPGRRLAALYWIAACYPLFLLFSLHITWLSAWWQLDHVPRSSLDDPKDIDAISFCHVLTFLTLFSTPFALLAALGMTMGRVVRMPREDQTGPVLLFGVVALSWISGLLLLGWDPFRALDWYMD